jgi:hypothetical protein
MGPIEFAGATGMLRQAREQQYQLIGSLRERIAVTIVLLVSKAGPTSHVALVYVGIGTH